MNQAELCRAVGMSQSSYGALESMKDTPFIDGGPHSGQWREPVLKLADFHGVPVEDLFPPEILKLRGGTKHASLDVTEFARLAAAGPEELLMLREQIGNVKPMLSKAVTKSEARVLTERFGFNGEERTLTQIAERIGISRSRAGQLQERALGKMRKAEVDR